MSVSFEEARSVLAERLSGGAYEHSLRVADTAAALALIYRVDAEKARLAGLLHDWDRSVDRSALVDAARTLGIEVGESEMRVPYLLHALTGAAGVAEALPALEQDVLTAIERHTVGAPDMSDLDKVLYIADMIEPDRRFEGVDDLREAVGELTLDALFVRAYEQSLMHLIRSRRWIHPVTVEVWNRIAVGEPDE